MATVWCVQIGGVGPGGPTPNMLPSSWQDSLLIFRTCFTTPSLRLFGHLVTAWVLCPGRHTLTRLWSVMPPHRRRRYGAYTRFIRAGQWSMDHLWEDLVRHLVGRLVPEGDISTKVDDTLIHKTGRKVDGAGWFRDAVRSTARQLVLARGLNMVVITLCARPPWGGEPISLPILVRLHRKGGPTPIELTAEMVSKLHDWLPNRHFRLVGDGAYAACLRYRFELTTFITRIRRDAALYNPPPTRRPGQPGRPPKKGCRLPTPVQIAATATDWLRVQVRIGDQIVERDIIHRDLLWYQTSGDRLLRLIVVRDPVGHERDDFFVSSDPSMAPADIATAYHDRWSIEVCFRDTKQHVGAQDPQSWFNKGPERAVSMAFLTHSLVWDWFIARQAQGTLPAWPDRPWYTNKTSPSFADAFAALRYEIWTTRVFGISRDQPLTTENTHALLRVLAEAA